jgi:nucleolar protein 14
MPNAAGSLWHRLLGAMQKRLAKELRDRAAGAPAAAAPCWPSPGHRLLLKLLGDLFPTTDFRHPVTTPAALLLGQYLRWTRVCNARRVCVYM